MIPLQTSSPHPVTHILFSPDEATIAVAQPHHGVTLLERATGRTLAVCAMPRRATLTGLTFCGDGRFLAAASAKGLEIFDADSGKPVTASFSEHHKNLLLAERGGAVVGAGVGDSRSVRLVLKPNDAGDHEFSARAVAHCQGLVVTAFSPDGRLTCGLWRYRSILFLLTANRVVAEIEYPRADESAKQMAKFCPLGRRFTLNNGCTLDVYDAGGLAEEEEDADDQQTETPLVQRVNGTQAIAVAPMPHVKLTPTFTLKSAKPGEVNWYPPFALAADGRGLLVKRPRNRVQLWDAPTGTLVNEWSWRFEWVTCVALSPDGLTAVVGGRHGRVLIWDLG